MLDCSTSSIKRFCMGRPILSGGALSGTRVHVLRKGGACRFGISVDGPCASGRSRRGRRPGGFRGPRGREIREGGCIGDIPGRRRGRTTRPPRSRRRRGLRAQPHHRVDHHHRRHFAAGKHVITDGEKFGFETSRGSARRNPRSVRRAGRCAARSPARRSVLIEPTPAGRQGDQAARRLGRSPAPPRPPRPREGPSGPCRGRRRRGGRPPACAFLRPSRGCPNDGPIEIPFDRSLEDALTQEAVEQGREQRQNVKPERREAGIGLRHHRQARRGRGTAGVH